MKLIENSRFSRFASKHKEYPLTLPTDSARMYLCKSNQIEPLSDRTLLSLSIRTMKLLARVMRNVSLSSSHGTVPKGHARNTQRFDHVCMQRQLRCVHDQAIIQLLTSNVRSITASLFYCTCNAAIGMRVATESV